jgi:puromycin-sensitive aminopeptidase
VVFEETMEMSTYLVAFIVGPFQLTDPVDVDTTPLRVAYPPGKGHLTAYGLETGAFALRFYSEYYGIAYPSDKLDLVAIPDFAFGAMENLGCVTFREVALLIDPARAPQPDLQRVADVVHHEVAHMWFGDLVTMRWWNGIWLNEAFATFMEMKCTDAFRPQWQRWVDFAISRTAAFDVDSLESTRPIEFEVVSPEDAEGMFDILTYEKGAAVLLMLEQFLGEDAFMEGVRRYLTENAYGNTETTDLWDSIEAATAQPVRQIMDTWIFQGGYPILSAGVTDSTLNLAQRRFRYWGDDFGEQWLVPVLVRYGAGEREQTGRFLLDQRQGSIPLEFPPDWVVVNAGAAGFYRVGYSQELLEGLSRTAREALSAVERYQLLDDSFAGVLAGITSAADFFELAQTFADETDLSVWQRLAGALGTLDRVVEDSARERYRAAVRSLIAPALGRLGVEPSGDEDERTGQLRGTLFEVMGTLGDSEASKSLAQTFHHDFLEDPDSVDPALAAAAIQVVAENGGPEDFETFWQRHLETDNPQLKTRYLHALARFQQPELIDRILELALTEVRTQDGPFLLQRALTNRTRGPQAWRFIVQNWERITERFPPSLVVRMVSGVSALIEPDLATEVEHFFEEHPLKQGEKTLAQYLEKMRVNVALRQRESARFSAGLG